MLNNTDINFFSFLGLMGACVTLDYAANDIGYDDGFCAANWPKFSHDCEGAFEDDGEVFPCEECEDQSDLKRFASFVAEQLAMMVEAERNGEYIDIEGHDSLDGCSYCDELFQDYNSHDCYGTRGEAHEAAMMG
jgi:hypothetical protein